MPEIHAATFNFADLADYCGRAESADQLFRPAAHNLYHAAFAPTAFDCAPPFNLDGHAHENLFKTFPLIHEFAEAHGAGEGFIAVLGNARIATPYAFLFDRHGILFNDSYHNGRMVRLPMERIEQLVRVDIAMTVRDRKFTLPANTMRFDWPPRNIEEPCLLLASPWCEGYHHWLLEALPRLWAADQYPELRGLPVVVPDWLTAFHADSLTALGYSEDRWLRFDGGTWDFQRLYVPSFIAPGGHSARQVSWLRERFAAALGIEPANKGTRLYVSRRDAGSRRLLNENEIAGMLERDFGFDVVAAGELGIAEQAAVFAEAEIIVGADGAGLTNHVFAPPGAAVVALHPADYVNRAHWYLSCAAGQRYGFEIGTPENDSQDFAVPPAAVAAAVERALAGA